MNGLADDLTRSVLAGASTGSRTFTALAAQALTARPGAAGAPDSVLARPWVQGVVGLLALGELVADKLPMAPSRLEPPGLSGRLVVGAACGAIVARRERDDDLGVTGWATEPDPTALPGDAVDRRTRTLACVLAGLVSAAATSWTGVRWRAGASRRFGRDRVGAVLEDAATVGLAV
ncbi:DUF4126 family protein, partial [Jatrophihabitans endophyticus]|uniref:DUF4126 family protein n=1 Tax=Jatrophihabitans endophyticus TaxID=1206085 RepID=UPI0019DA093A